MKNYLKSLVVLLLLCNSVFAEAKAVISGPSEVLVNNLFFLSTEGTVGDNTQWILPDMSQSQEAICGTTKFLVINRAGKYEFILVAADKNANISYTKHVVTVKTASGESPIPDPIPDPVPDLPVGFDSLKEVSKAGALKVSDPTTAVMLANAIDTAVTSISSDTSMSVATASMGKTIESCLLARAGVSRDKDWLNFWRKPVNEEMVKLSQNGKIATTSQYLQAMKAISSGLR